MRYLEVPRGSWFDQRQRIRLSRGGGGDWRSSWLGTGRWVAETISSGMYRPELSRESGGAFSDSEPSAFKRP